jgi:hypothetical protein
LEQGGFEFRLVESAVGFQNNLLNIRDLIDAFMGVSAVGSISGIMPQVDDTNGYPK